MRIFTLTLLAAAASLFVADTSNADDDISKGDGVVYLESTESGLKEKFNVYRDGNEIEIEHSVYVNSQWVEVNSKDYFINNVDLIHFVGDNDDDHLIVNGWNTAVSVDIPVIAYGLGGDDSLFGGATHCVLYGGPGEDVLVGSSGDDYLDAGEGVASVYSNGGADVVVIWQQYVWNSRFQKWDLEDLTDVAFTDFGFSNGDTWEYKIKSKYLNQPVTNPPMTRQSAGSTSRYFIP